MPELKSIQRGVMGFPCEEQADSQAAYRNAAERDSHSMRTLYVHIPFCRSRCPFCPFFSGLSHEINLKLYADLLCRELEISAKELSRFPINAVYFGGGTPTEMNSLEFQQILNTIRSLYPLTNDCEITVEGRIDDFTEEKTERYFQSGVNRFSIGIQTFDTKRRRSLGRSTSKEEIISTLNRIVQSNQVSVVIDLLYGLPGQTFDDWNADLDLLLNEVSISGVDFYHLKSRKHLPLEKQLLSGTYPPLPSQDECFEMFNHAVDRMNASGVSRLSSMHFAFSRRERNWNNSISAYKNVCLPFGMKAVGQLGGARLMQTSDFAIYSEQINAGLKPISSVGILPPDFPVCGELSGELYNHGGISLSRVAATGRELTGKIFHLLQQSVPKWIDAGYLHPEKDGWFRMTELAHFRHRPMATDLMETIARAWL